MKSPIFHARRALVSAAGALFAAASLHPVVAQTKRRATPSQTEGPYYPLVEPKDADFDLLRHGDRVYTKGQAAWVEGTVTDLEGRPLKGGVVEIWQCDEQGRYDHPRDGSKMDPAFQGFGRVTLNDEGLFRFRTIRPSPYVGRTPHIHAKFIYGGRDLLTTQFYVEGDPGNAKDMLWRSLNADDRAALTAPYLPDAEGLKARYSVVLRV